MPRTRKRTIFSEGTSCTARAGGGRRASHRTTSSRPRKAHLPYISYASAPSEWTLDNGSPFPEKKPFLDPAFDAASRTFTGWIDWMVDGDGAQPGGDGVWKVRYYTVL